MLAKVITLSRTAGSKGFRPVMRYVMRVGEDAEKLAEGERFEAGHVNFGTEDDDAGDSTWFDPHTDDLSDPGMRAAYAEDLAHLCERAEARCRSRPASRFRGNAVYHVAINWREGEHPTRAQAERACLHVMQALGYSEHQAAWAVHRDTDNDHIHLVINKVHPVMATVRSTPRGDYFILDKCMRELELEFGHGRANGPYVTLDTDQGPQIVRMSRAERRERGLLKDAAPHISDRAARAEHNAGGAESFQSWVAGAPAAALRAAVDKPDATWRDAHEALAEYGLTIQRKGSGLIVTTVIPSAGGERVLAAKASQLGRWASKSALEQRLGEFTPPADPLPPPVSGQTYAEAVAAQRVDLEGESPPHSEESERTDGRKTGVESGRQERQHQQRDHSGSGQQQFHGSHEQHQRRSARDQEDRARRRAERQAERDALAARFTAGEAERREEAKKRREALRARHSAERKALTERLRTERQTARAELRAQGIDRRTADSLFAFKAAAEREQLAKRQRDERQALGAELSRGMVWRRWVESHAAAGDEAAQAALRGILYRERRKRHEQGNGIEGDAVDPLTALHEKLRRGPDDLVLTTLSAERDRLGRHITYRRAATGTTAFIDRGPRIDMVARDDPSLEAALRIAAQKYGGQVLLTGSAEFQERAARMATRLGIRVVNPDLAGIVRDAQQQPYDHRAWAAASQRVREEREKERREAEDRRKAADEERRSPELPPGEAESATPPPVVQRTDPDHRTLAAWWNRRSRAERAAWMAEAAAADREQTARGAWHRWRDYQDAGPAPPPAVLAARKQGQRGRDEGR